MYEDFKSHVEEWRTRKLCQLLAYQLQNRIPEYSPENPEPNEQELYKRAFKDAEKCQKVQNITLSNYDYAYSINLTDAITPNMEILKQTNHKTIRHGESFTEKTLIRVTLKERTYDFTITKEGNYS